VIYLVEYTKSEDLLSLLLLGNLPVHHPLVSVISLSNEGTSFLSIVGNRPPSSSSSVISGVTVCGVGGCVVEPPLSGVGCVGVRVGGCSTPPPQLPQFRLVSKDKMKEEIGKEFFGSNPCNKS
jgi:hypothetical protein